MVSRISLKNTEYAKKRAEEAGVSIKTITGDAREADRLANGPFDYVLLMGPMYHLFEEKQQITAIKASLNLLKQGGILFVSFLNMFSGIIYYMKHLPDIPADPSGEAYVEKVIAGKSFASSAFTEVFLWI